MRRMAHMFLAALVLTAFPLSLPCGGESVAQNKKAANMEKMSPAGSNGKDQPVFKVEETILDAPDRTRQYSGYSDNRDMRVPGESISHSKMRGKNDTEAAPQMVLSDRNLLFFIAGLLSMGIVLLLMKRDKRKTGINVVNNMKIGTRIIGMVAVILILLGVVAGFGIIKMTRVGGELEEIAENDMPLIRSVTAVAVNQLEQAIWFERALLYGNLSQWDGLRVAEEKFTGHSKLVNREIRKTEEIAGYGASMAKSADSRREFELAGQHIKEVRDSHFEYERHVYQIFNLLRENEIKKGKDLVLQVEKEEEELNRDIEQFLDEIEEFTEQSALRAEQEEKIAVKGMWIVFAIALVLGIALGIYITRSITGPLHEAVEISNRLANGELSMNIDPRGKDETGQLLVAMRNMVENLGNIVASIRSGADNVASAAAQLSTSSQALSVSSEEMSQGASEQASVSEQVSSSMEQMSSNIRQNADNSLQTEKIALNSAEDARKGGDAVMKTVKAMSKIAEKISIVEEIARQTDLLALNAAIEAARAGDHGKGFAVVASEVRKLAERSQKAAGEINKLSGSSVDIAENAGEMLAKLVPDIKKTAELVQEISAASNEQNAGTEQINNSIQQLDRVTQQNATVSEEISASAEELSSTSEMLASQAANLQKAIRFFKMDGNGSLSTKPHQDIPSRNGSDRMEERDSKKTDEAARKDMDESAGHVFEMEQKSEDSIDAEFEKY